MWIDPPGDVTGRVIAATTAGRVPSQASGSMTGTPAGSKCRLLCVATVWPWKSAVAAMRESSHVIVRFLVLRSESSCFQRTNTGSVNYSVAAANFRRISSSQAARLGRCVSGA